MKKGEDNSSGVASVVLGILSVTSIILFPFGWLSSIFLGILGLIFGIIQSKSMKSKWSTAGIILSIIGIIFAIAVYFWMLSLANNPEVLSQLSQLQGVTP